LTNQQSIQLGRELLVGCQQLQQELQSATDKLLAFEDRYAGLRQELLDLRARVVSTAELGAAAAAAAAAGAGTGGGGGGGVNGTGRASNGVGWPWGGLLGGGNGQGAMSNGWARSGGGGGGGGGGPQGVGQLLQMSQQMADEAQRWVWLVLRKRCEDLRVV